MNCYHLMTRLLCMYLDFQLLGKSGKVRIPGHIGSFSLWQQLLEVKCGSPLWTGHGLRRSTVCTAPRCLAPSPTGVWSSFRKAFPSDLAQQSLLLM